VDILERGEVPEDKVFTVTCSYCKSVLKMRQDEVRSTESKGGGVTLHVDCPICAKPIFAR
jgi:endogenous inhibitor of DNA gyrase (YacG/DUF329 family)